MKIFLFLITNVKSKFIIAICVFYSPLLSSCVSERMLNSCDSKLAVEQLYKKTLPSVAVINTGSGLGSGFVVEQKNGKTYLLTNSHVTAGKIVVEVIWADKIREKGYVVGDLMGEQEADIALVEVEGIRGNPIKIQESPPPIGSDVVVIGAPRGLDFSMSRGIVSQLRKDDQLIQVDAPINPGNSGGPILSSGGCISGMVTFKKSDSEGLNFAIAPSVLSHFLANPTHVRFDDTAVIEKAPPFFVNVNEMKSSTHIFRREDNDKAVWDEDFYEYTWFEDEKIKYWIDSTNMREEGGWKSFNVRQQTMQEWEGSAMSAAIQCDEGLILWDGSILYRKMGSEWWEQDDLAELKEEYEHQLSSRSERYYSDFALGTLAANSKRILEKSTGRFPRADSAMRDIIFWTKDKAKRRGKVLNPLYKRLCESS